MLCKVTFLTLISLMYVRGEKHLTTSIPLGIGVAEDEGEVISGIFAATGTDETIYVLTPEATGSGNLPITATVIEKESDFVVQFSASSSDVVLIESMGCGMDPFAGKATCTENLVEVIGSQTASTLFTTTGFLVDATVVASSGFITSPPPTSESSNTSPASTGSVDPSSIPPESTSGADTAATTSQASGDRRRTISTTSGFLMLLPALVVVV